jgi:hypothetical protein
MFFVVFKIAQLDPILGQKNSIDNLKTCVPKIHFNIILIYSPVSPISLFPSGIQQQFWMHLMRNLDYNVFQSYWECK